MYPFDKPDQCRRLVHQWFGEQVGDPLGPDNPELLERVRKALANQLTLPREDFVELLREIRGNKTGWTEVGSPSQFQKEFGISQSTWLRRIEDGSLVIDDSISDKSVRVQMDCYNKFRKRPK